MNDYQFQSYIRGRLEEMTDTQLHKVGDDIRRLCSDVFRAIEAQAGKPFWEITAELIAEQVRNSPKEMASLKVTVADLPVLARHMLKHFPDLDWLQEAADKKPPERRTRKRPDYRAEAVAKRDATLDAWQDLKEKVDNGTADHAERLSELIVYAECAAGAWHLGAIHPVKAHLREQRIDGYTQFLARLATPEIGMASPTV